MSSFIKKNWLSLLTFAATSAILIVAATINNGINNFIDALKTTNYRWFLVSVALIFIYWSLDGLTLHILTITKSKNYKPIHSFVTAMLGLLYSALTPFSTGGQPFQIYYMNEKGIKPGAAGAVVTVKSIVFQLCMVFYAIVCSMFMWGFFDSRIKYFGLYMFFGILANLVFIGVIILFCVSRKTAARFAAAIVHVLRRLRIVKDYSKALKATLAQVRMFRRSIGVALKHKRATAACFIITLFQLSAFYMIPFCIYMAFHLSGAPAFNMISANAIITMITAFVPIPGASVAAEGSFYIFFRLFFPTLILPFAIILWRLITYYFCIIFGVGLSIVDFRAGLRRRKRT
jgi:uncharacterized protein (TIRG00374 family)